MINGDYLDEIRSLPTRQCYHFALISIDSKLENQEISEEQALDMYSKVVLDYIRNKKEVISDYYKKEKIVILDAIMGTGKSTYIIDEVINRNPQNHYLCVLKTLDECGRYAQNIEADIYEPKRIGTKTRNLQRLIANGRNIVTTHALIQNIDDFTLELLKRSNYVLIIDECLDVVHQYENNFKPSDFRTIIKNNYVSIDDEGFLNWNDEKFKEYDGRYNDIKRLCNLRALMCTKKNSGIWSESILMWNFPVKFFSLFEKCYICTYLWNGSMQKAYFDMHKVQYIQMTIRNHQLDIYSSQKELEQRGKYWKLIDLYNEKMNGVGIPDKNNKNPLCVSWYQKQAKSEKGKLQLCQLQAHTYNYFRNIIKSPANENMYTTFKSYRKYIGKKGFSKGFVPCNSKATNDYRHKSSLAYLVNLYPPTNLIRFFESNGIKVNQDLWALSELLQWIWRSQIRDGKPINLYMPSQRMRELLGNWALGKI